MAKLLHYLHGLLLTWRSQPRTYLSLSSSSPFIVLSPHSPLLKPLSIATLSFFQFLSLSYLFLVSCIQKPLMALHGISCSNTISNQRKHFPIERRPRMLKDFLIDDSNSCSSTGFKSFPRQLSHSSVRNLIEFDLNATNSNSNNSTKLLRSRSMAAFQAVVNAIKHIPFTTVKPPSILPRSFSRKLSKRSQKKETESKITITIKDIIRWKSFRDLVEEKSPPSDYLSSPAHCNTTNTTSTTCSCSSSGSSWCDSDFTTEFLPTWCGNSEECGENEVEVGKNYSPCVGKDSLEATTGKTKYNAAGPMGELPCEEKEQNSPVSVLDYQFEEDEESFSSFNRSIANLDRAKQNLMGKFMLFESLAKLEPVSLEKCVSMKDSTSSYEEEEANGAEEKAMQLLSYVKTTSSHESCKANVDQLLFDFFKGELATQSYQTRDREYDCEIVSTARSWMSGEHSVSVDWGVEHKRQAYIRDMDTGGKWSKFEEEQEELALEIESGMLEVLVDEVVNDLLL